MRLFNRLEARLRRAGVEFFTGFPIQKLQIENARCKAYCWILQPAAEAFIGVADSRYGPFSGRLLGNHSFGVNGDLRPVDATGALIAENLYAAGAFCEQQQRARGNAMRFSQDMPPGCSPREQEFNMRKDDVSLDNCLKCSDCNTACPW